jgi:imidazolonepropionase-like amidohydrolase
MDSLIFTAFTNKEESMSQILFRNCGLLDGTQSEIREGYDVLVVDDRIEEVSDSPIKAANAQVIDLRGRTLMPGLTDAHVHVTAVDPNIAALGDIPPSLLAAKSKVLLEQMLMRGFTTVRDAGGADWGLAEAVKTGLFKGPRLLFAGHPLSQTGGHGDSRSKNNQYEGCACGTAHTSLSRLADGVDAVRKACRDELRKGATQIKIMASGGVASPTDHVANTQYSLEEIRAAVEEAEAARTYVMAHAYTARAIKRALECGVRSIEHANLIDQETAELATEKGAFVVPTMVTYQMLHELGRQMGLPEVSQRKVNDVREAALVALEILQKAGTKIGHGSDLLGDMHQYQSVEFSLKGQVLSPYEVIKSATTTNAELFNMVGEVGVIAPGAFADLLVIEGNPLKDLNLLQEQGRYMSVILQGGQFAKNELAG